MYMPNAKNLRWGPNAAYIPLETGFSFRFHSRWVANANEIYTKKRNVHGQRKKFASPNARDTNMLVFFALGNTKVLSFALRNAKLPDASSFTSQWNIGLTLSFKYVNGTDVSLRPKTDIAYIAC